MSVRLGLALPGLALLAVLAAPAGAQDFGGADGSDRVRPPSVLTLPETLRGAARVPVAEGARRPGAVGTVREIFPVIAACWAVPLGLRGFEEAEVTLRFSLRRDGSVQGEPRVTFSNVSPELKARQLLADASLAALRRCAPIPVTPDLGAAIAGRPLAMRFIYRGPRGKDA